MLLFLVIATLLLESVSGQARDPTKVCLPDIYQTNVYNVESNTGVLLAIDFTQQLLAVRNGEGLRSLLWLNKTAGVVINETDGKCQNIIPDESAKNIASQCLPANAVLLTNTTTFLGLNPTGLEIEGWSADIPNFGLVAFAVTTGTPAVLVLRQFIGISGIAPAIQIFTNPQTVVNDKTIFTIPSNCQDTPSIVG